MEQKPKPKPDDPAQYKRFLAAAHDAEVDETEKGADRAFKSIVKPTARRASHVPHTKNPDSK
jgi:hypothetical protein